MSRASRSEWAKRVERWKDSGLSAKEFAAETGVKSSSLSYWKWKLGTDIERGGERIAAVTVDRKPRASRKPSRRAAGFVEVSAGTVTTTSSMLEIMMSGGARVRVPAGFDEETLMRVVRVLEASR
jgi:transposase